MRDLGCHRPDYSETLRLELGVFQPFSFFHLSPQRGRSTLNRLLKVVVRTAEGGQEVDDNEKEHKKHDRIPSGNKRMVICRAV
jgi:hypothetical protein